MAQLAAETLAEHGASASSASVSGPANARVPAASTSALPVVGNAASAPFAGGLAGSATPAPVGNAVGPTPVFGGPAAPTDAAEVSQLSSTRAPAPAPSPPPAAPSPPPAESPSNAQNDVLNLSDGASINSEELCAPASRPVQQGGRAPSAGGAPAVGMQKFAAEAFAEMGQSGHQNVPGPSPVAAFQSAPAPAFVGSTGGSSAASSTNVVARPTTLTPPRGVDGWGSKISEASSVDVLEPSHAHSSFARHGNASQVGISGGDGVTPIAAFDFDDPSLNSSSVSARPAGSATAFAPAQQQRTMQQPRNASDLSLGSVSEEASGIGGWGAPAQRGSIRQVGLPTGSAMGMDNAPTPTSALKPFSPGGSSTIEEMHLDDA